VQTTKKLVILMEYMGLNRNIPIGQENNQDPAAYEVVKKAGDLHIRE